MGELRNRIIVQSRNWITDTPDPIPNLDFDLTYPKTVYDAVHRTMDDESTTLTEEIAAIYRLINGKQDQVAPGTPGDLMTWSGITGQIGSMSVVKAIHVDPAQRSNKSIPTEKAIGDLLDTKANLSDLTRHINDTSSHITDVERTKWNAMAPMSSLQSHISNTHLHVTDAEKDRWNKKANQDELDEHIYDATNPHNTTAHQVGTYTQEEIDSMFKNIRESFFNYLNIEWDSRYYQAQLVPYNATNWNPNYVLAFGDELPDVENDELTYFALRPNTDYKVNETQDCIIWVKIPGVNWQQVGTRSMKPGDLVIRYPDTGMFVWLQGHFMHLFTDATNDSGEIIIGDSDNIWYPSYNEETGIVTWVKSKSKEPPVPMKIKGEPGYTPIKGVDYFDGEDGVGVPVGGSTGDILVKSTENNYDTTWKNLLEVLGDLVLAGGTLPENIVKWDSIVGRPKWYTELGENDDGFVTQRVVSQRFDVFQEKINEILQLISGTGGVDDTKQSLYDHVHDFANPHRVTPAQIGAVATQTFLDHTTNFDNPHQVTAELIGLGNVNNTSDADKPISNATQQALDEILGLLNDMEGSVNNFEYITTVAWTNTTCTLSFIYKNGKQMDVKIPIPEIFSSMWFDNKELELVIELPDGTEHRIDVAGLIRTYYGSISENIHVTIEENNTIRAVVLPSSITGAEIINSVYLRGAPTTTTQPPTDKSDRIATTEYVRSTVIDNLISYEVDRPLSANQGRILNRNKVDLEDVIELINDIDGMIVEDNLDSYNPLAALSANMGRYLNLTKAPRVHTSPQGSTFGMATQDEFGHVRASSRLPLMDGNATPGIDNGYFTREGHVHPTDVSRSTFIFPDKEHGQYRLLGEPRAETPPVDSCDDRIATTEWVRENSGGTLYFGRSHTLSEKITKVVELESSVTDAPKFTLQKGSTISVTFAHDAITDDTPVNRYGHPGDKVVTAIQKLAIEINGHPELYSKGVNIVPLIAGWKYKKVEEDDIYHGSDKVVNNLHMTGHDNSAPNIIGDPNDSCKRENTNESDYILAENLKTFSDNVKTNIHNRSYNNSIPITGGEELPILDVSDEDYKDPTNIYRPADDDDVQDLVDEADGNAGDGINRYEKEKEAAKQELREYAEEKKKDRDEDVQQKIDDALRRGEENIDKANSLEGIQRALDNAKKEMDYEADPLRKEKDQAKDELEEWFEDKIEGITDPDILEELEDLLQKGKDAIDDADDEGGIQDALDNAKKEIEEFLKNSLGKKKEKAKQELTDYAEKAKQGKNKETQKKIDDILKDALKEIDNAETIGEVNQIVDEAKKNIDHARDTGGNADPLDTVREAAKEELEDYGKKAKSNFVDDPDIQQQIDEAVKNAQKKIDEASDLGSILEELQKGKDAIDKIVKENTPDVATHTVKFYDGVSYHVTVTANAKPIRSGDEVAEGSTIRVTVDVSDVTMEVDKISVAGVVVSQVGNTASFTMPRENIVINVTLREKTEYYHLYFSNGDKYVLSVMANSQAVTSGGLVAKGATVTVNVIISDNKKDIDAITAGTAYVTRYGTIANFIMPAEDTSISVTLKDKSTETDPDEYVETYSLFFVNGNGYTISATVNGSEIKNGEKVMKGEIVSLTVNVTDTNKTVDTIVVGNLIIAQGINSTLFNMPAANSIITVTLKAKTDIYPDTSTEENEYSDGIIRMNAQHTGAYPIMYGGENIIADMIKANYTYIFTFDGIYWQLENPTGIKKLADDDMSNSLVSSEWVRRNAIGVNIGYCYTAADNPLKTCVLVNEYMDDPPFIRQKGSTVVIQFTNNDDLGYVTMLDVHNSGPAVVMFAGSVVEPNMIAAGHSHIFTFDGIYWNLLNPAALPTVPDGDNSNKIVTSEWVNRNARGVVACTCSTGGQYANKVAKLIPNEDGTTPPFILRIGSTVAVTFTEKDVSTNAYVTKLNVDDTGAYPIIFAGATLLDGLIGSKYTHAFVFDGTYWRLLNPASNDIWDEGGLVIGPGRPDPKPDPGPDDPDEPDEPVDDTTVVNLMSGYFGYTLKGNGTMNDSGYVDRVWFMISFTPQEYDLQAEFSGSAGAFGAKMGNGNTIILDNPTVINISRETCVVQFDMNTMYPSNSPCHLIYRTKSAWINFKKAD